MGARPTMPGSDRPSTGEPYDLTVDPLVASGRPPTGQELAWALLNASNEVALLVDTKGIILAANEHLAHSLRRPLSEIVGRSFRELLPPALADQRAERGDEVIRTKRAINFEDEREGRVFLNTMSPILGPDGSVAQVAAFALDITELRRSEQEQRLAALGRLSAGVAHEFNNLMGALLLAARMVRNRDNDPELAELVELVVRSTTNGREICSNLLAFAQARKSHWEPAPIERAIEAALSLCAAHIGNAQVLVERDFDTAGCQVLGAPTQLEHVFINLIINACQAMPSGGRLRLQTRHEPAKDGPGSVVVTCSDTGEGIEPEHLTRVFEPFFTTRLEPTEEGRRGTGLGLSVCYGIVERHGGTVEAVSSTGGGAVFTIRLPACEQPAAAQEPRQAEAQAGERTPLRARVLVAEDQPDMLQLLRRLLRAEGCVVRACERTDEALEALEQDEFDVVVSDYRMPGGGAPRLLTAALALPKPPPLVIITGSTDATGADRLLAQGAAACLFKPFELDELRLLLAKVLAARASG